MKENSQPKISVNKLGEYITASPIKKRSIIKDQISPPKFKTTPYNQANSPIISFILSEMADGGFAENKSKELRNDKSGKESQIKNRILSADAIDAFLDICSNIDISSTTPQKGHKLSTELSEVRVDLNPEILLINNKKETVGFIKIHYSKTSKFSKKTKDAITSIIYEALAKDDKSNLANNRCYLVDIGTKSISTTPKNRINIIKELEADCEFYALLYKKQLSEIDNKEK